MDIKQLTFVTRELATECTWATAVSLSKGRGKYRGIDLVEVIWKVNDIIIE